MTTDPFAPPAVASPRHVTTRDLRREGTVWRVASWLLFFGTFNLGWSGLAIVLHTTERRFEKLVVPALFVLVAAAQLAAGLGLRRREPWSRPLALVASVPVLLLFPIGTWVAVRSVVALLGAPGQEVLARNYPRIPADDRSRPSVWVPIAAPGVLVAVFYVIFRLALP